MNDALDEAALQAGPLARLVEVHAELGSTNDRARDLIVAGAELPALVVAERQTAGRGRGANRWWAADGALTFSVALDAAAHGLTPELNGLVSLITAVAIVDAVRETTGLATGVKWPNDVHLNGKKLAGVLNESPRPGRLVLGVGINVANRFDTAPEEVRVRATSIIEHERATRQEVLGAFLTALDNRLTQLAQRDPRPIGAARAACVLTGKLVTLRDGERLVTGECLGIADDGALRLTTENGVTGYYAGTIEQYQHIA